MLPLAFLHMTCVDAVASGPVRRWTPIALLMAAVFVANRLKGGWHIPREQVFCWRWSPEPKYVANGFASH